MRDRLPTPGKENRVRITLDNGQVVEGVLSYADDATQEGSTYTKGNVLPDSLCGTLGIDPESSEPKDAFHSLYDNVVIATNNLEARRRSFGLSTFERMMYWGKM